MLEGVKMTSVAEIKKAVQALPDEDFGAFSSWFDQYEEERWDRQIEHDQKEGPLRSLMTKAQADFKAGKCDRL
jgi:hypothetical protein